MEIGSGSPEGRRSVGLQVGMELKGRRVDRRIEKEGENGTSWSAWRNEIIVLHARKSDCNGG